MIAATLFSGIGAPEMAMPHWRWAWSAEIGPFASAVLSARYPDTINLGDVTAPDFVERALNVARPDVIVFGNPCQSFSVAGRRLGLDDPRGKLALVALGIVARLKPRWFVFENVPGLLSSAEGRDFGLFLRAVDELGYSACWAVLDAQYFGVAQRRQRVFTVGHSGDWRYPAAVLFESESLCGNPPTRRKAGQEIATSLSPGSGSGSGHQYQQQGTESEFLVADTVRHPRPGSNSVGLLAFGGNNTRGPIDIAAACNAHGGSHGRLDFESETLIVPVQCFDARQSDVIQYGDKIGPLDTDGHTYAINSRAGAADGNQTNRSHARGGPVGMGISEEVGYSLRGGRTQSACTMPALNGAATLAIVRRLTPRECARLQGFPDDYLDIEYRGKPATDGPRYKVLGNSMAVPVMRWILSRIEKVAPLDSVWRGEFSTKEETQ